MSDTEMVSNILYISQGNAAAPTGEVVSPETRLAETTSAKRNVAFDEIYRNHASLVHGILLGRIPYDDVNDVVQEVFLAAYKNLPGLRDRNAVGAWLARIARNRTAEYYRQSKPTAELSDDFSGVNIPNAEAVEILTAIRNLPETYRETLILRLVEGMTGNEIAERTGLTPDSVRVNLHRGMELLRQKLGIAGTKK